jgi:UDP-galactopyranose mutase
VEEPTFDGPSGGELVQEISKEGVRVCVPRLPGGLDEARQTATIRALVDDLMRTECIRSPWRWYYSPMMWPISSHLPASRVVYDCMDELSAFAGAHQALTVHEQSLLDGADAVFTGGRSLYLAKRSRHHNVHAFPSSVDAAHFATAPSLSEPADQAKLPHPRVGFFGVIDERLDVELVRRLAAARPSWQIVMIGPIVKIDPAVLPRAPNLHWMGPRSYAELPAYLSGWDVAILPFALNEATRFISPTKTLEYLAAGRAVVSTPIADVVDPYGTAGVVRIADREGFVAAVEAALQQPYPAGAEAAAAVVASGSWDRTWSAMDELVHGARSTPAAQKG